MALASGVPITLSGVHDVNVSQLGIYHYGNSDGVDVVGSHDVTLDGLVILQQGLPTTGPNGITIDGASASVTVSRNQVMEAAASGSTTGYGIRAEPGSRQVTITTNWVRTGGISVSGAAGADITSNSVINGCRGAIGVDGGSTAVVVENNAAAIAAGCASPDGGLSVTADSVASVQADYNVFRAAAPATEYDWGGQRYLTPAAFHAATGQGAHDIDSSNSGPYSPAPPEGSPMIDSADCAAPGELATDFLGQPRVADPLVPFTGNGTCHADRGAFERQDVLSTAFTVSPATAQGLVPLDVQVTAPATAASPWNEPVTYTADFGAGGGPVTIAAGATGSYTYSTPGSYLVTMTAADTSGSRQATSRRVIVATAAPSAVSLSAQPAIGSLLGQPAAGADEATFTLSPGPDAWQLTGGTLYFGDNSSQPVGTAASTGLLHVYQHPGTYTAKLAVTDVLGRVSTATATITVGAEYSPHGPYSDFTGVIPAHGVLKLSLAKLHAAFSGIDGVALRIWTGKPTANGFLTAYPDGAARPAQPSIRFLAGQSASGLVQAVAAPGPSGVDIYNGSAKPVSLAVDTVGLQVSGQAGNTYAPDGPVRVLNTATGLGTAKTPVPANATLTFPVAGRHGVPANATAVVLDVTASGARAAGYASLFSDAAHDAGTHDVTWLAKQAVTGLVVVPLTDGNVRLRNSSPGQANFAVDVVGYYYLFGTGAVYLPVGPRLLTAGSTVPGSVKIAAKGTLTLRLSGVGPIPATGLSAVAVSLTASGAAKPGAVTAYPAGAARPATAALSFAAGQAAGGAAIIGVSGNGAVTFYNGGSSAVCLSVVLTGFYYQNPNLP